MNATSLAWKISKVLLACQIVVTSVASSFTTPAPVFQYGHQVRTSTTTRRSNNDGTVTQLCAISRNPLLLSFLSKPSPPSPPPSPAAVIQQQVTEFAKHSSIIGQLKSIITKFVMTPTKTKMILKSISHAIQYEELFFFAFMGWAFVPLLGLPQTVVRDFLIQKGVGGGRQRIRSFKRSNTKLIADQIAGISRIGFIVYITDILKLLLLALGFKHPQLKNMPNIVAKSLITWWVVNRLAALKRYILAMETRNNPGDLVGSVELVNHLIDAFLYGFGAYVLIDHLQTNFSAATTSLAAFGGVSTLVVSLASQGLITQVFYGLFLAASNKIRKGEVAEFGDGAVSGLVASIGWTDTLVRGGDGVLVSVPNRELGTFYGTFVFAWLNSSSFLIWSWLVSENKLYIHSCPILTL